MTTQTISSNVNGDIPGVAPNDIYLNADGNLSLSFDQDALLQICNQACKTLLGELVFNTNVGVTYQESVWVGVPNFQQFNASLRQALLSIDGVVEVISLNIVQGDSQPSDTLSFTAIIRTIYGTGVLNG